MINYYFLILGYFLIFISILLTYFRLRKISLSREDYWYWLKIEKRFYFFKNKIFKIINISERELKLIWSNFIEKILRRIKIEALKIETWAGKKLEDIKKTEDN